MWLWWPVPANRPRCAGPKRAVCGLAALGLLALLVVAPPSWAQPRVMIIGDSIQSGTNLRHVTQQAAYLLQRTGKVVVHNFSSPGARMMDQFPMPGMNQAATAVYLVAGTFGMRGLVVAIGTNDWALNADLDQFRDSYAGLLAHLPPGLPVACLSPPWRESEASPNGNGNTLDEVRDVIRAVCAAAGGTYLDGKAAIPNAPAYFIDGVHPNARGHRAMARFLKAELTQLGWLP